MMLTIEAIAARAVMAPLVRPITTAHGSIPSAPLVLIDVICSQGVTGRAYIFGYTPITLKPLVETISNLVPMLQGQKVAPVSLQKQLEGTFRLLGRQGMLGMALAGLDMAFWDALGKENNASVVSLLGGNPDPVPCYDSHGVFNPQTSPAELEQSLAQGFRAVKFKIGGGGLQKDIDEITAIRDIIGNDIRLMVDYNQSLTTPEAIRRLKRLSEFDLDWVEEPVPAEDFTGHCAVRNAVSVPIQTGENWWMPEDAARAMTAGISDHAMLDIMKIGGVTGWLQASALAAAASLPVSSHIFVEASAHVMPVTPGAHLIEYLDVASAVLTDPCLVTDGALTPRGLGLGIEWNESAVEKYSV
ncbi:MAG: enolase C-terminal domain-like protein [Stappiaceae bacterium]